MKPLDIIIIDGQTVQAMAMAQVLSNAKHRVILLCDKKMSYGYYTKYAIKKVISPKITDSPEAFKSFFIDYCTKNPADIVFPSNDDSATFLSKNRTELLKYVKFLIPEFNIFQNAYDKNSLMALCREKNYPHPLTADLSKVDIREACNIVGYPAILKPNLTSGGRGMAIINSYDDLAAIYTDTVNEFGNCHLQQYIPFGGRQFKVQIYRDQSGEKVYHTIMEKIRYYPEKGGSSCCNKSVEDIELFEVCNHILSDLGWIGFADFDLIEDIRDGKKKVMEINPRVPACIKTSFKAGVDFANIMVNDIMGEELPTTNYKKGIYLRYFGLDLLWFVKSSNRFKTEPSWFNFIGKNIYYQDGDLKDPMPFIVGTLGGLLKQLNPKFRRAKSGLDKAPITKNVC